MLNPFLTCLVEQLEKRRYGEKRQAEIVDRFNGLRENYALQGLPDPDTLAMTRVLDETDQATRTKQRLKYDALLKRSALGEHFDNFDYNKSLVTDGKKANPGNAAISLLSPDARSKSGINVDTFQDVYRKQIWAGMADTLDKMGKGVFGIQKGKGWMNNVVDEIYGQATGDNIAAQIAKTWLKGSDMVVDLMNMAGGAMQRLEGWGLPQPQNMSRISKAGFDSWSKDHMDWLAWEKMRWPNGAPIKPDERLRVLKSVFDTLTTDGGNKVKPGDFGGQGGSLGNLIDEHRFLVYKDGPSWRAMAEKYGDGNVFDTMANYVDQMAHKMALVRVFGANVENGMKLAETLALSKGAAEGGQVKQATQATLTRFDQLSIQALRRNSMDPESFFGNAIVATSNMLNSAQLAGAVLAAIPGDFATTMAVRAANHMPVLDGLIGPYVRGLVSQAETKALAAQSGFLMDSAVHTLFSKSRFAGFNEYGPAWSKRVADVTMRASGMNIHTDTIRWVTQSEMMGMLARDAGKTFDQLPYQAMAQRYGITADMWDKFRAIDAYEPRPDAKMLRPVDLFNNKVPGLTSSDRQALFERFQSMILQESKNMVIDQNPEANVMLKGNMRADTIPGALLHSFAMYKNFPIGMALTYGRLAMSIPDRTGRLSFLAGLGASLLLAGAVGLQLREMSKGRDALPMDSTSFWGKAMLASGAMSIWGDFLFNGVNKPGGPTEMAAGPIVSFVGDTTQLALGDMFDFADKIGSLKAEGGSKTPFAAKLTEYASRYQPGSSLWYARLALQRELYDPLRIISDPRGYSKMQLKERKRVKDFGNESFWQPGERAPDRAPQLITSSP